MANGQAFEAATGDGPGPPDPATDPEAAQRRAAEVRVAYEGLLQIRRSAATPAAIRGRCPHPGSATGPCGRSRWP